MGREKIFTLYDERDFNYPYTDCHRHSDPISLPNSNTNNLNERLIWGIIALGREIKTYTRRTINREAATVDKKEAT
jgi:hypothetical protein